MAPWDGHGSFGIRFWGHRNRGDELGECGGTLILWCRPSQCRTRCGGAVARRSRRCSWHCWRRVARGVVSLHHAVRPRSWRPAGSGLAFLYGQDFRLLLPLDGDVPAVRHRNHAAHRLPADQYPAGRFDADHRRHRQQRQRQHQQRSDGGEISRHVRARRARMRLGRRQRRDEDRRRRPHHYRAFRRTRTSRRAAAHRRGRGNDRSHQADLHPAHSHSGDRGVGNR